MNEESPPEVLFFANEVVMHIELERRLDSGELGDELRRSPHQRITICTSEGERPLEIRENASGARNPRASAAFR